MPEPVSAPFTDPFETGLSRHIWETRYRFHPEGGPGDQSIRDTWRRVARALAAREPRDREGWEQRFHGALVEIAGRVGPDRGTSVQCRTHAGSARERSAQHPQFSRSPPMNQPAAPSANSAAAAAAANAAGGAAPHRPSVIQLAIKEKGALYAAYIPLFSEGGIFIPTSREYRLGDDVYVLLTLPEDPQRYPVAGKVAWITPARAAGSRAPGVGIRFPSDEKSRQLKARIEAALGGSMASDRPTQTI